MVGDGEEVERARQLHPLTRRRGQFLAAGEAVGVFEPQAIAEGAGVHRSACVDVRVAPVDAARIVPRRGRRVRLLRLERPGNRRGVERADVGGGVLLSNDRHRGCNHSATPEHNTEQPSCGHANPLLADEVPHRRPTRRPHYCQSSRPGKAYARPPCAASVRERDDGTSARDAGMVKIETDDLQAFAPLFERYSETDEALTLRPKSTRRATSYRFPSTPT